MSRAALIRGLVIVLALAALVAWLMWRWLKRSDDPKQLVVKWLLTLAVAVVAGLTIDFTTSDPSEQIAGVIMAAVYGLVLAILWAGSLAEILARRVGSLYDGGNAPSEPQPLYSIAEAKCKQGKYREALYEIQSQLARFPHDMTGQMMMAQIQAAHLADLPGAQLTIERFCQQPGHPPRSIAAALTLLADLQLQHASDTHAARQAFETIIERLPDTPEAQNAAQRIAHLATAQHLEATHKRAPIKLPTAVRDLGLQTAAPTPQPAEPDPETLVAQYVSHLEAYPLDDWTREKLAVLYADHYRRLDLATEQLEQLIQQPNAPAKHVAQWLNVLADLQVKLGAPIETGQQTLQRIIDLDPAGVAAEPARQRLALLKLEYKRNEPTQAMKLGTYEKDLGLKQSGPRRGKECS